MREAFIPYLARVNRTGQFVRRVALMAEIPQSASPIIDLFVGQHLLIKDWRSIGESETDKAREVIEVAHEVLLQEWPALKIWLSADREFLIFKEQIAEDVAAWRRADVKQNIDAPFERLIPTAPLADL